MWCQCNYKSNIRTDCIHYHCEHDMGASIDCCTLKGLGNCPCTKDCPDYVDKAEVYRLGLEMSKHLEQKMQWIPCSETVDIPDHEVLACDKYGEEILGYLEYADEQWMCASEACVMYDPIAWMEKPEPYKEEG